MDQFFATDLAKCRSRLWARASLRSVGLLATASPANFQGREDQGSSGCLWPGCSALGAWEHIAWRCRCRPAHAKGLCTARLS